MFRYLKVAIELLLGWRLCRSLLFMYIQDGRKWPSGRCRLTLSDSSWPASWRDPARAAIDRWNAVSTGFDFLEDSGSNNGMSSFDMGTWNGRLALAWVQPKQRNHPLNDVQIVVNTYWVWDPRHPVHPGRDPSGARYDLQTLLLHELGHALWLGHNHQDPTCIMYGAIPPNATKDLAQDDMAGLRSLYP